MQLKQTIHVQATSRDLQWHAPLPGHALGAGSQLADLTPEAIQASGDHELLNWIIALGIIGDTPAEIVDVRESHTQLAFRAAAVWEYVGA